MVSDIVTGITIALNKEFGDSKRIYTKNIEQGLKTPCFFVKLLTMINSPLVGKRSKREYPFDIHYFPVDETDNEDMMAVGDQLLEALGFITMLDGDQLMGRDMQYQIIEGVLHFSVTYACTMYDFSRDDSMLIYDLDEGVISDGK